MNYELNKPDHKNLELEVCKVIAEINEKPFITDCCLVGIVEPDSKRPIKFASKLGEHLQIKWKTDQDKVHHNEIVSADMLCLAPRRTFHRGHFYIVYILFINAVLCNV